MIQFDEESNIEALLEKCESLPFKEERLRLALRAVELADLQENPYAGFYARCDVGFTAMFLRKRELVVECFQWCSHVFNQHPEEFDAETMLWLFKYVIECSHEYASLSYRQISLILDNLRQQLTSLGFSLRTYYYYQTLVNAWTGRCDMTVEECLSWKQYEMDSVSDCRACEQSNGVLILSAAGHYEQAIQEAEPLLEGGLTCAEEPGRALAEILFPLYCLNDCVTARDCCTQAYDLIQDNSSLPYHMSLLIRYLALTGQVEEAMEIFNRHAGMLFSDEGCWTSFHVCLSVYCLAVKLSGGRSKAVSLELPEHVPLFQRVKKDDMDALTVLLREETERCYLVLDKRHRNRYFEMYYQNLAGRL